MTAYRLLISVLLLTAPLLAASREERVQFPNGKATVTLKGTIKGSDDVDYILPVDREQSVTIALRGGKSAPYFNVLEPGNDTAIFIGSVSGEKFEGKLSKKGDHIIHVYLMRSSARRGASAPFTLTIQKSGK